MKKLLLACILFSTGSYCYANYWDCEVDIYGNGFWGWNWDSTSTVEIQAESRTRAESKALNVSGETRYGAFGTKIHVCPRYDFDGCKYRVQRAECRRQ